MGTYKIVIPGNTPSLKNSKQIVKGKNQPHPFIISSKAYKEWSKPALLSLNTCPLRGKEWKYPLRVSFHFIRDSKRRFDHLNIAQGPLDLMVEAGIIADDDMEHVVPGDFSWQVNKTTTCVIVTIEEPK